jgi:succinyl-diaminopimelate desuccinylase
VKVCKISGEAFLTRPGPFTALVAETVKATSPAATRTCRPPAAPPTPASSAACARWSSSAWSARPCTQVDERVPVEEIRQLAGAYEALINRYFAAFA